MFIGHFAPAFAAAAVSSRAPKLATLFIGAQLVDWAFFTLAIFGVEKMRITPGITAMNGMDLYHMPYTHSLLGSGVWALAFGLLLFVSYRQLVPALLGAIVVMSHWVLDWLVHRPDLTLAGSPPKMGLGLWNYPWIEMPLEIILTLAAFVWFLRTTKGPIGPAIILIIALFAMQAIDWFGGAPQQAGIGLYVLALVSYAIATALAWWVDDTRWHKRQVGLAVPSMPR
ncbi:membrane protein, putative [Altererythrobacter epoxidivorans]|uniref:Membrane protein, putative n=1 Tax=Altererythrobacter epoxidivorans TaxID=361183 RepID=A0A0M4M7B6_9SPHN|nr:hypothetical protein [Altererythrobacter epoxidivorans]ALE16351.1 membrane protein, putative [Altererythrobacter epoxidivorans]